MRGCRSTPCAGWIYAEASAHSQRNAGIRGHARGRHCSSRRHFDAGQAIGKGTDSKCTLLPAGPFYGNPTGALTFENLCQGSCRSLETQHRDNDLAKFQERISSTDLSYSTCHGGFHIGARKSMRPSETSGSERPAQPNTLFRQNHGRAAGLSQSEKGLFIICSIIIKVKETYYK